MGLHIAGPHNPGFNNCLHSGPFLLFKMTYCIAEQRNGWMRWISGWTSGCARRLEEQTSAVTLLYSAVTFSTSAKRK